MANALTSLPMVLDTDITTWRNAASVKDIGYATGIRIKKLILAVGASASTAGSVSITAPSDSSVLYPPLVVSASQAALTILYVDNPTDTEGALTWRDFAVTGLTATGTKLYLWWDV